MYKQAAQVGLLLSLYWSHSSLAQEQTATSTQTSDEITSSCQSESALLRLNEAQKEACLKAKVEAQKIERIEINGQFIGLQVPEIIGRFTMDRKFFDNMPRTGGDFTELLGLLPGVELGDEYLSADNQAEIGAQRVSIWGNEAWQTGFFLDGMNFNSRQDPESYLTGGTSINDVEGSTQTFNINQQVIESLTVYTNNVPANYGGFSGGVVEVETRQASPHPSFGFNYRTSQSDWNQYRVLQNESDYESGEDLPISPAFEKNSIDLNYSTPIGEHHSALFALSYVESNITDISLNQGVDTSRKNTNVLAKLSQKDLWLDEINLTINYAPYETQEILKNVLNSDYQIEGGGVSTSLQAKHQFDKIQLDSRLSLNESHNSRYAPPHYYPWAKVTGKEWGVGDDTSTTSTSLQGGYGDIDKTQQTLFWDNNLALDSFSWLGLEHQVDMGFQYQFERLQRQRFYDTYRYNSPVTGISQLNCSGYGFDCVELATSMTLDELAEQLGETVDFSNPLHVLAYSNTVTMAPQYFSLRFVYPQEDLDIDAQTMSAYITDSVDWKDLTLNFGIRADYDDFFKRLNIAPRFSGGYRVAGNPKALLTFGLNRYYSTNLLGYKLKEQALPYTAERREVNAEGAAQGWQALSGGSGYRYLFKDVASPFNDEVNIGWKQATGLGNFSVEYVKRWKKDTIVQLDEPFYNETDGYNYRYQANANTGWSDSVALSWAWQYGVHSMWLNTTYTLNNVYYDEYDESTDTAEAESLAYQLVIDNSGAYTYTESTVANIERANEEFSQPIRINAGWSTSWTTTLTSSFTATYVGAYDAYYATTDTRASEQLERICAECSSDEQLLVPIYQKVHTPKRILLNMATRWQPEFVKNHALEFRFDVQNLFNARTYTVSSLSSGVETGRSLWLGVGYQWH